MLSYFESNNLMNYLKTRPKQLLGFLPLSLALSILTIPCVNKSNALSVMLPLVAENSVVTTCSSSSMVNSFFLTVLSWFLSRVL